MQCVANLLFLLCSACRPITNPEELDVMRKFVTTSRKEIITLREGISQTDKVLFTSAVENLMNHFGLEISSAHCGFLG